MPKIQRRVGKKNKQTNMPSPTIPVLPAMTPEQNANFQMSLTWKNESRNLLLSAKDKTTFTKAFKWCGDHAGVSRTISGSNLNVVGEWLWKHLDDIKKGTFLINNDSFIATNASDDPPTVSKYPISWISKICHIINPIDYPIIYDGATRGNLKNLGTDWKCEFERLRKLYKSPKISIQEAYKYDSQLWATYQKNEK